MVVSHGVISARRQATSIAAAQGVRSWGPGAILSPPIEAPCTGRVWATSPATGVTARAVGRATRSAAGWAGGPVEWATRPVAVPVTRAVTGRAVVVPPMVGVPVSARAAEIANFSTGVVAFAAIPMREIL